MTPIPAATAILMHMVDPLPEFLLVRRNPRLPVQGDVWVFPGGHLEEADRRWVGAEDPFQVCAMRETREEAGVVLDGVGMTLLIRWITPSVVPQRFDARYFLAPLAKRPVVTVDGREIVEFRWMSAAAALEGHLQGRIRLAAPGFVTLYWMARLGSATTILEYVQSWKAPCCRPRMVSTPRGDCLLFENDAAYGVWDLETPGPRHRLWMAEEGWQYRCDRSIV